MSIKKTDVAVILQSERFKKLVNKRWSVSISLTAMMLFVYVGFILLIAFNKEFLATKIGEHITIGIPIGIGIIIFAWLLTGVYVRWANSSYDKTVREMRKQLLGE